MKVYEITIKEVDGGSRAVFYGDEVLVKKLFVDEVFSLTFLDAKTTKSMVIKDTVFKNLEIKDK